MMMMRWYRSFPISKSSAPMPHPSAAIIVLISSLPSILSERAFSTCRILPLSGRMAWKRRSRPCLAVPPADSPSTRNSSQRPGSRSEQSASLPGRPPPSSAPLRRVRSRALRAASRARAASIALLMTLRSTVGFCSKNAPSFSFTTAWTTPAMSEFSLPLVWPSNWGCGSFTHVIAGQIFFYVLEQAQLLARVVDGAGQGGAEAGQVRAAIHGVDVVRETEDRLGIAVVVLQADLDVDFVLIGLHVDRLVVQYRFAAVQVLDKFRDAAVVLEFGSLRFAGFRIRGALVGQRDQQALVKERQLTEALRQGVEVVFRRSENALIGKEVNLSAALLCSTGLLELRSGIAFGIGLLPGKSVTPDFEVQIFAECVDAGNAYTMQSTGNFVRRAIELAAGVELGHHDLGGWNLFAIDIHRVDGNAAAVIYDRDGVVDVNGDFDFVGMSSQRLVNGIVHDLVHEVVQTHLAGRADVHSGPLADGFHPAKNFDRFGSVVGIAIGGRSLTVLCFCL